MTMSQVLQARPVSVQVKHRGAFVPPLYNLVKAEVSIAMATELAQTYNLKSTGIIVNRNATSTQYLSFRYFLPGEPFRYLDVSIGMDQTEITFFNPATVDELMAQVRQVWNILFKDLQPIISSNYLEANLHCETDGVSTKAFLNELVNVHSDKPGMHKGFSLTSKGVDTLSRIGVDVSDSVADGLYVVFAYVGTGSVRDMASLGKLFNAILVAYRGLQSLAHIELIEPT